MSKKIFEHYVNLIIVDSSISVCNKTDFSSYRTFAEFISTGASAKNFTSIERYLVPIVTELAYILGLTQKESAIYIAKFFKNKKWVEYHPPLKVVKERFNIFLVP